LPAPVWPTLVFFQVAAHFREAVRSEITVMVRIIGWGNGLELEQ
jgi:hypothetical protein